MSSSLISDYFVSLEFLLRGTGDKILHACQCVVEAAKTRIVSACRKVEYCTQVGEEKLVPSNNF